MRFIIILTISLLGCNQSNQTPKSVELQSVDSVIQQSQSSLIDIKETAQKTDSAINQKVTGVVKKIENLNNTIKELKDENNALKSAIDDNDNVGKPFDLRPISNNKGNQR